MDAKRERVLRWRLEQQLGRSDTVSREQAAEPINQTDDQIDPLDLYMETLVDKGQTNSYREPDLALDLDATPTSIPTLDLDSQDVIGNACKRPKTLECIPDTKPSQYEPFRKAFINTSITHAELHSSKADASSSAEQAQERIKVKGTNPCPPIEIWEQCGISSRVLSLLKDTLGFSKPTAIQSYSLTAIMSGRDLIGVARTGSGKTLAYCIPLLRHVLDQRAVGFGEGPIALVLVPTRELALQVLGVVKQLTQGTRIRSVACYGGPPIKEQIGALKRGAEVVVSTPGRMIDLLCANGGKVVNLHRVTFLVLDEADRMFDAGFEPQVMKMIDCTRTDRQTVMFSATFPRAMEALAKRILNDPLEISVLAPTGSSGKLAVCEDVDQRIVVVEEEDKFPMLLQILGEFACKNGRDARVLVFVERQEAADHLLRDLLRKGYLCASLHGGKDQADRDCTIADFKQGVIPILVATSVASRGLDVQGLKLVVNYDCPNHAEDYVHRVGRTGRAGTKGTAYTLITPEQSKYANEVCKVFRASGLAIPEDLQRLGSTNKPNATGTGGYGGKGLERLDTDREMIRGAQKAAFFTQVVDPTGSEPERPTTTNELSERLPARMRESWGSPFAKPLQTAISHIIQRLISIGVAPKSGIFDPIDPVRALNERFGFSGDPASGEIVPIPEGNAAALSVRGERMSYCCEVLINSYSQQARWRVTSRDNLSAITLATGTAITVRGTYVPPGRTDTENERKLYLYVEGESKENVQAARDELRRLLALENKP